MGRIDGIFQFEYSYQRGIFDANHWIVITGTTKPAMEKIADLNTHDTLAAGFLVLGIVFFGLLPASMIDLSLATITKMNDVIQLQIKP